MPVQEVVVSTNYVTLVVNSPSGVFTTVNKVQSPTSGVVNQAAEQTVLVGTPGPQGPPGPPGPSGSGSGNVFIQNTAPGSPPAQYLWIQTDFPSTGHQTVWVAY